MRAIAQYAWHEERPPTRYPSALELANALRPIETLAGAILLIAALELQTRFVEEPYLSAVHGERYTAYASNAGRSLPGIGRL